MCCNPANGRVDIVELSAYKIQLHGLKWNKSLSADWGLCPTKKNSFSHQKCFDFIQNMQLMCSLHTSSIKNAKCKILSSNVIDFFSSDKIKFSGDCSSVQALPEVERSGRAQTSARISGESRSSNFSDDLGKNHLSRFRVEKRNRFVRSSSHFIWMKPY